jgi:hypothetical protein
VVTAGETALGKASSSPSARHKRSNQGCNVEPRRAPRVRLAATAPAERPATIARGTVVACACTSPLPAARAWQPDKPAQTWARREWERAQRRMARAGPTAFRTQILEKVRPTARKRHFQVLCAKEAAAAGKSWSDA